MKDKRIMSTNLVDSNKKKNIPKIFLFHNIWFIIFLDNLTNVSLLKVLSRSFYK